MDDPRLVDLEVDLTRLHFLDSSSDVVSYRTALRVWHKATRTEYTTQSPDLTHDSRHGDDDVDISPATADLLDVLIEADIVSTSSLGFSFLIRSTERKHTYLLPRTVGEGNDATNHLICLARIDAEANIHINRSIELGIGDFLYQHRSFAE